MNFNENNLNGLRYLIVTPDTFDKNKKYPVILYMHGAGSRGNKIEILKEHLFFQNVNKLNNGTFLLFAPLCTTDTWFDLWEKLEDFVKYISSLNYVDTSRIYMTGASMGGYATWQLAMSLPDYFAAIAPVCGGGMYWNVARLVNVPVWAFHGAKDGVVLPRESEIMVEKLKENGGDAKLTVYPNNEHDAWTDTYSNPQLYEWFLSNINKNTKDIKNKYTDSKIYG